MDRSDKAVVKGLVLMALLFGVPLAARADPARGVPSQLIIEGLAFVGVTPPSGVYVSTQAFDVVISVFPRPGAAIIGGVTSLRGPTARSGLQDWTTSGAVPRPARSPHSRFAPQRHSRSRPGRTAISGSWRHLAASTGSP
jgi:hypothetical protein